MMLKGPKIPDNKSRAFKLGYWTAGLIMWLSLASVLTGLTWLLVWCVQGLIGVIF